MKKIKQVLKSIANSMVTILIFFLFWLFSKAPFSFITMLKFIVPYYILWLIILCISIKYQGKPFRIIWMGSLRDDLTFSKSNIPYAVAFLLGSILILIAQYVLLHRW